MNSTDAQDPLEAAPESLIPADLIESESKVRNYSRYWPVIFQSGSGSQLYSNSGQSYLDFFAGAGALNYGHNNPVLKRVLVSYLESDGIVQGTDMMTTAKANFMRAFRAKILQPRRLDYKMQFTGPTGTNAVEAALKLARKATGRLTVAAFTNAFHGMSLGSLAVTAAASKRAGAGLPLGYTLRLPYDGYGNRCGSGLDLLEEFLQDRGGGVDSPAAVIVETVQGDGGVNVASVEWLQRLRDLCWRWKILLIIDDVQTGCGRTGAFFSFEIAGLQPDLVILSKSISGYGLPMALLLVRPELDIWEPGEHNGTFRGNNAAFVTSTAALDTYWTDDSLTAATKRKSYQIANFFENLARHNPGLGIRYSGRGLIWGVAFNRPNLARLVSREAFARRLVIGTVGVHSHVLRLLPPLTMTEEELEEGLGVIADSIGHVAHSEARFVC